MSTRSRIGYVEKDGSVVSIYSHWDGYPSHHGTILLNHYKTLSKVKSLVKLGAISSLGTKVSTKKPHTFDRPQADVTVAYHRDRGEDFEQIKYNGVDEFVHGDIDEWGYLFKDGKWYVVDGSANVDCRKLFELTKNFIKSTEAW
jgi:hypothetical protein